jgi:phosphoribosylamine--glycine ligase
VEPPRWRAGAAVTVVVAAEGYPGEPRRGDEIRGVEAADGLQGVDVIHAGTAYRDGRLVTAGGRVLAVTAVADDLGQARDRAYDGVACLEIRGAHHRSDIALAAAGASATPGGRGGRG